MLFLFASDTFSLDCSSSQSREAVSAQMRALCTQSTPIVKELHCHIENLAFMERAVWSFLPNIDTLHLTIPQEGLVKIASLLTAFPSLATLYVYTNADLATEYKPLKSKIGEKITLVMQHAS